MNNFNPKLVELLIHSGFIYSIGLTTLVITNYPFTYKNCSL